VDDARTGPPVSLIFAFNMLVNTDEGEGANAHISLRAKPHPFALTRRDVHTTVIRPPRMDLLGNTVRCPEQLRHTQILRRESMIRLCFARTQLVLVAALLVFPTAYATAQPGPASAPTSLTCGAYTANQPSLRQEGTTEAAGDILISCTGPLSASQTGKQTLSLIVSGTAITSRKLYKGTAPASIPTEAALLIDDCTVNTGTSSSGASCAPSGTYLG
jgi:hypothetical protein